MTIEWLCLDEFALSALETYGIEESGNTPALLLECVDSPAGAESGRPAPAGRRTLVDLNKRERVVAVQRNDELVLS